MTSSRPASRTQRFAKPSATRWTPRSGYWVSHTPERPEFNYGHALLLDEPPWVRGIAHWLECWRSEQPASQCDQAFFMWELSVGEAAADQLTDPLAVPSGSVLYVNRCLRLAASGLDTTLQHAAGAPPGVDLRPLQNDDEWRQATQLTALVNDDAGFFAMQRAHWLYTGYRSLIERGVGEWLGAFTGERLVGAAGLLRGAGEARFQDVLTHPDFRGRGICSAVLRRAVERYHAEMGERPVFIVAKAESAAERLYRRLGFEPTSVLFELSVPLASKPPTEL